MIHYPSIDLLQAAHQGVKKWNRALLAIENLERIEENRAYSIVDSLTYHKTTADKHSPDDLFVGHRRYFEVIIALDSNVTVELAQKTDLTRHTPYSDLTDREHFEGTGTSLTLAPGEALVTEIAEALRISKDAHAHIAVLRITVEGASFHNK